jgi:phage FluMu protein Com
MVLDGKISGQSPRYRYNSGYPLPTCAKCNKLVDKPTSLAIDMKCGRFQLTFHYVDKEHFIYEAKSGFAVVYCSKYCRDKHNHRYFKRQLVTSSKNIK